VTFDSLLNKQFDEYRLEKLLGRGGMARVYRGFDTRLNRYVAIKVVDTPFKQDSEYIGRFEKEARAIAQLNHPNIVTLYRYNEVDGRLYMAMQYVEGSNLEKLIPKSSDDDLMPLQDILFMLRQLCSALDYAHQKGVIHRDVKPSNIMMEPDGHVYLTDFGLALMPEIGTMGTIFGSPHYIAPEQAMSSAAAVPQSDYYAVGVMLYEMFTGRLPFQAENPLDLAMLHLSATPPPLSEFNADVNPAVEGVVLKLLAKEPEDRYENGKALIAALDAIIASDTDDPQPSEFLASRVSSELEKESLPAIPAQNRALSFSIPRLTNTQGNGPTPPVFVIAATVAAMLLCVAAMIIVIFILQDDDEPSAVSQATEITTATVSPEALLTPTQAPSPTTPPVLVPMQNGVGLSTGRRMNDGGIQVQGYCNPEYFEGYTAVSHDSDYWYCHRSRGSSDKVQLTQENFDQICQLTYSDPNAVAMQVDGPSIPAFNWKCFGPLKSDTSSGE